jgi:hypothetical protein
MRASMAQSITSPASVSRPIEDTAELVLAKTRSWVFVAVVAVCFAVAEVWLVHTGRTVHDEGILTWMYASYLARDPVATLFFLKAKPALAAINLPGTLFGVTGFYFGHIAIGAAGVLATAAAARAARLREWGVAALIVASSPMYGLGTGAGFSNVDAAALTAVALSMIFRSPLPGFGTGLVLALLPCVRFEAGVFAATASVSLLARDRNPRLLAGLLALPLGYLAAGALWHHDVLWWLHFPAAVRFVRAGVYGAVRDEVSRASGSSLLYALTTMTPVLGLAALRVRGAPPWVRVALVCIGVFLVAMLGLPQLGAAMGYSQRYLLAVLPVTALVVAWQIERAPSSLGLGALLAVALFALPVLVVSRSDGATAPFTLSALIASSLFGAMAFRGYPRLATVGLVAFVLAWPNAAPPMDAFQPDRGALLAKVVGWLRSHPEELGPPRVVVTNLKLLDASLAENKDLPTLHVRCLIQTDNAYELRELTNPENGQRARILALARWRFYGEGVLADEFAAAPGPPGALVVLARDPRLGAADADTVAKRARVLLSASDLTILRLAGEPASQDLAP